MDLFRKSSILKITIGKIIFSRFPIKVKLKIFYSQNLIKIISKLDSEDNFHLCIKSTLCTNWKNLISKGNFNFELIECFDVQWFCKIQFNYTPIPPIYTREHSLQEVEKF